MGNVEQNNNVTPWVPIAKNISSLFPKDGRPYTEVEAVFCLQLDHNNKKTVSITGYSKLWGWGKDRVLRLLSRLSLNINYPEDTAKKQNQLGFLEHKINANCQSDPQYDIRLINFIDFNKLGRTPDRNQSDDTPHLKRNREIDKKYIKDPRVRIFQKWFFEKYKFKFKREYLVTNWAQLGSQVKKLLSLSISFEDLQYLSIEFLLDEDKFINGSNSEPGTGHNIGMLLTRINQNAYKRYLVPEFREDNCKHIINEDGTLKY